MCRAIAGGSASFFKISSFCRSEEHTSELQSHLNLVCRLLLEKKKKKPDLSAQWNSLLPLLSWKYVFSRGQSVWMTECSQSRGADCKCISASYRVCVSRGSDCD